VLGQVGDPYESLERRLDDAGWVAGRLAEILPLPPAHKQHCLEIDDPVERLRFLRPLFEITTEPPTEVDDADEPDDSGPADPRSRE
jgi:Lon protease-like protein